MKKHTMIVAGGSGIRMGSSLPKQFLNINGVPVLMHTIHTFNRYDPQMPIMLVLPIHQMEKWFELCRQHSFNIPVTVCSGGETRFHSVKKNLPQVPDDVWIAIHDGVRPLVSLQTIETCFSEASIFGNAVPCIEISETIRITDKDGSQPADRTLFRIIQTPQVFNAAEIKRAYEQNYSDAFTDDASVCENNGTKIHLVKGNVENIKITIEKDLIVAGALMLWQKA